MELKYFMAGYVLKELGWKYTAINCIPMPCNTLMKTIQREVLIFHDHLAMLDTSEELMDTSDKTRIFNALEENSIAGDYNVILLTAIYCDDPFSY